MFETKTDISAVTATEVMRLFSVAIMAAYRCGMSDALVIALKHDHRLIADEIKKQMDMRPVATCGRTN